MTDLKGIQEVILAVLRENAGVVNSVTLKNEVESRLCAGISEEFKPALLELFHGKKIDYTPEPQGWKVFEQA